ncbi:DoxX family protein [Streptomyces sp. NPDC044571]|uniref:DoxX family protein n=1 Tax=Streptomyces sp. NPDC044571 TaxID=3155371 RepID=UPI0033D56425
MSTATVITIVAAVMVGFSAVSVFLRTKWVVEPLADYGVPQDWWNWLGAAKAAGAAGLLVGFFVPVIGLIAAVCTVLYFTGAVITVIRARSYAHVPFPMIYAAPVVAALALGFPA